MKDSRCVLLRAGWFRRIPPRWHTDPGIHPASVGGAHDIWQCRQYRPAGDTEERCEQRILDQVLGPVFGDEPSGQSPPGVVTTSDSLSVRAHLGSTPPATYEGERQNKHDRRT